MMPNFCFGIDEPYVNNFPTWGVKILVSCKKTPNVSATHVEGFNLDVKVHIGSGLISCMFHHDITNAKEFKIKTIGFIPLAFGDGFILHLINDVCSCS